MCPRIKRDRIIQRAPDFSGFKPYGVQRKITGEVVLHMEEYESIKLCDYELLTQVEASKLMNVSRPTFTRVYESARRKIAQAFAEAKEIRISGGNVSIENIWYKCQKCSITFNVKVSAKAKCPLCGSLKQIEKV